MKTIRMFYTRSSLLLALLLCIGCDRKSPSVTKLIPYSVTNRFAGGEFRQILQVTNGMTLYFTSSNIVIGFCEGATTVIDVDPKTRRPTGSFWTLPPSGDEPGQEVLDFNGDCIPDYRELKDEQKTLQIFFRGEWYTLEKEGNHNVIIFDGKKIRVHFDGRRWVEVSIEGDPVDTNISI